MSRHETDWLSLYCGLVFTGLGLAYLLTSALQVRIPPIWALPGVLIALGLAGLIGTARTRRGHRKGT